MGLSINAEPNVSTWGFGSLVQSVGSVVSTMVQAAGSCVSTVAQKTRSCASGVLTSAGRYETSIQLVARTSLVGAAVITGAMGVRYLSEVKQKSSTTDRVLQAAKAGIFLATAAGEVAIAIYLPRIIGA